MARNDPDQAQYRPAYPADDGQAAGYRPPSDGEAEYPDWVYQAQARQIPAGWEDDGSWAAGGAPRRRRHTALWAFIALICAAILCLLGAWAVSLHQAYAPFRQMVAVVGQDTFAQGVLVDQVHIGGLTRAQAEEALRGGSQSPGGLWLTVRADNQSWVITPNELPLERNVQAVLDTAYAVGRQGTPETIASSVTPFEYRYAHLYHTATTPVYLRTEVTYDPQKVWELVRVIENHVNRDAVDAQVATFDFSTRAFTFSQEQQGARLDAEKLYADITQALDRKDYTAVIGASVEPLMPKVSRVELMNSFSLVSSYTTNTTSDANRNNNINLAAKAVMGTVVMPGETFSFNETTGQRTLEKGYLPAAAIAGGATVDEVGGGVCQVSSTLFNAAAMADLTIVSRSPHTWPSNYVDKGRDATVNWPNLDFKFRNDQNAPVFIVAYYQQRACTVEIYGASLEADVRIDLETRVISTTEPPAEAVYEYNPQLAPGTVQEKKKARTGYVVETYKVYRRNGAEIKRELLCVSTYQMIQQVIEYNGY